MTTTTTTTTTTPPFTGYHHLGLTVRDVEASEAWYSQVLGLVRAFVEPHHNGSGYAVVMTRPGLPFFLGLDHHDNADNASFAAHRTGLDHLAFGVAARAELDAWVTHLDAHGVEHDDIVESSEPVAAAVVNLWDPDGIALELVWMGSSEMATVELSQRPGPRPDTSDQIPHSQLDQQPNDRTLTDAVIDEARTWPHVREQESGISVEGARALVLDGAAAGPADAFLVGTEFCHGHAQGDFSFHAALPAELAAAAERAGWAEPHFLAATGQVPPTVVMIYAPRDDAERATVLELVRASYQYALGAPASPASGPS